MSEENAVTVTAEESADFARVEAMMGDGEPVTDAGAVAVAESEPQRMDAVESLTGLLSMLGAGAAVAGFRRTAEIWTPEACGRVAGVTVPVLRKYPWGARVMDFLETGTGAEEVALVMVAAPLVMATVGAVKADMAGESSPQPEAVPVRAEPQPEKTQTVSVDLGGLVEVHGHANG